MRSRYRTGCLSVCAILVVVAALWKLDAKMYPLRHLPRHRHCLKQTGLALKMYAGDHEGMYPTHEDGYGDALLLILPHLPGMYQLLTGPGYRWEAFADAHESGSDMPEDECGRVYIQGLGESNSPAIVVMYDKLPTPGTDHCFRLRHFAPLGRELLFQDGHVEAVLESEWATVVTQQVELLVEAGFERATAEWYYDQKPKEIVQGWRALAGSGR